LCPPESENTAFAITNSINSLKQAKTTS